MINVAYVLISALFFFPPATARAQEAMRTHVSGLGTDGNPCTAQAPCRSFQAALAQTRAGGQIYVLNSADYGPVTINKAVTITSEGAIAGVLATTGNAITINAGANDVINLRGLDVDGGGSGGVGIQFNTGASLSIQKSNVRGFNSGINFAPTGSSTFFASDVFVSNNSSSGIMVAAAGSNPVISAVHRVTASGNGAGILLSGMAAKVAITDTIANNNNYGIGAIAASVMVRNTTLIGNAIGISSQDGAVVSVTQATLTANGTGWQYTNGGQLQSYGNNNVIGNSTNGTTTSSIPMQ
jgi:hypothetical protein